MKLHDGKHKLLVYNLYIEDGKEKQFSLATLAQAASLQKKILDDAKKVKNDEGETVSLSWEDSDISLTLDEAVLVKELVKGIAQASPRDYEVIKSLKELLDK